MRLKTLCMLVLAALMLLGAASAEPEQRYEALTQQAGLNSTDLCAWLEIPGAGLTLPVMQHASDDAFYLKHNAFGAEDAAGALYTEKTYNSRDFSDPVTVVYGIRRNDGSMFGSLQQWYSGDFDAHETIVLHLPGETRTYTAFAAVPYSSMHLLYYNDFHFAQMYTRFVEGVYAVRRPGVKLLENRKPEVGERLIILSTSLRGDASQRYLVIAKEDKSENQ